MPSPLDYLEYGEEDDSGQELLDHEDDDNSLFGSDDEAASVPDVFMQDARIPITAASTSSAPASPPPPPQEPTYKPIASSSSAHNNDKPHRITADERMAQLRSKRARASPAPEMGVPSLKLLCTIVIRRNCGRIYDIGGMSYSIVAEFIDNCGRAQLEEIENNSPHIKPETDWLWEGFVLQEYPIYYEVCRERKGQPRTSGWRRMYQKAVRDAEERKQLAAERVAERYRQLEAERTSKRIVVLDQVIAPKRGRVGHSWGTARRGASASSAYNAPTNASKMQTAMTKARNDAQRARVALTHASGKFIPPSPRARATARTTVGSSSGAHGGGDSDMFRNPYLPNASTSAQLIAAANTYAPVSGARLPPPRIPRPPGLMASAYPTPREPPRPPTVAPTASSSIPGMSVQSSTAAERFRIDHSRTARPIHRPQVDNFAAPKPARKPVDFFAAPPGMGTSSSGVSVNPVKRVAAIMTTVAAKRQRPDEGGSRPGSPAATLNPSHHPAVVSSAPPSRPASTGPGGAAPYVPPAKSTKDLESVLFAKKPKTKSFNPRR